ncbi:MAG: hypothetical protein ACYC27_03625 [Armatimonadota bacterium]
MQQQFKILGLILLAIGIVTLIAVIAISIVIGFMASGINTTFTDDVINSSIGKILVRAITNSNSTPDRININFKLDSFNLYLIAGVMIWGVIYSVLHIIAGIGLVKRKPWARVMTLIVSGLLCLSASNASFFGPLLGLYGIWLMFNPNNVRAWNEYVNRSGTPTVS